MSKLNYVEWDIEDIGGHYEFTPQEMMSTDYLDMINLLKRGSGEVTYTFNCDSSIPKGTTITVRNNEFGADNNGNFFGIQILLNPDQSARRSSYWFFFENQVESFTFNGVFWKCNSPEPKAIAKMSFIDEHLEGKGYVNIKEFIKGSKKSILFSNVAMKDFKTPIDDLFFQHGPLADFGTVTKESSFEAHSHKADNHRHTFPIFKDIKVDVLKDGMLGGFKEVTLDNMLKSTHYWSMCQLADTAIAAFNKPLIGNHDDIVWLSDPNVGDAKYSMKDSLNSPVRRVKTVRLGDKLETRPKNIQGGYVIKCF